MTLFASNMASRSVVAYQAFTSANEDPVSDAVALLLTAEHTGQGALLSSAFFGAFLLEAEEVHEHEVEHRNLLFKGEPPNAVLSFADVARNYVKVVQPVAFQSGPGLWGRVACGLYVLFQVFRL